MITRLKALAKRLWYSIRPEPRSQWQPGRIYPDDMYIASYPRSGNTWVRFLFANLLSDAPTIHLQNIANIIPAIPGDRAQVEALPRPRIIKSHAPFTPAYPKVIYIVRDARDVYVSFYHFWAPKLPEGMTFSAFLRSEHMWPGRWHTHVEGWLQHPNHLLVRYEDLHANTVGQFKRMLAFWGYRTFTDEAIQTAVETSQFERMKRLEKKYKVLPRNEEEVELVKGMQIVRKGKVGTWNDYYTEEDMAYLLREAGPMLSTLGYLDDQTAR